MGDSLFDEVLAQKLQQAGVEIEGDYIEYNNGAVRLDGEFSLGELKAIVAALEVTRSSRGL